MPRGYLLQMLSAKLRVVTGIEHYLIPKPSTQFAAGLPAADAVRQARGGDGQEPGAAVQARMGAASPSKVLCISFGVAAIMLCTRGLVTQEHEVAASTRIMCRACILVLHGV